MPTALATGYEFTELLLLLWKQWKH